MRVLRPFLFLAAAAALAACKVDGTTFQKDPDASAGDPDTAMGTADAPIDAHVDPPPALAFIVSSPTVDVTEGAQAMVNVSLNTQPTGLVFTTIASSNPTKLGLAPTALGFDASNWSQPQALTVAGLTDVDTLDETGTLTISAPQVAVSATVDVAIHDDDVVGLVITPGTLDVNEDATAQLHVHLSAQPAGDVTVAIASDDAAVATVDVDHLTFTAATWNLDQTVTVSGMGDADTVDDTAHANFSATGLLAISVPVHVFDNDVLAIDPSTTNLGAVVEDDHGAFGVALTQQPAADLVVTITSSDPMRATVSPATLTFTTADWNTPQMVTAAIGHDVDTADQPVTLTLASPGLTDRAVALTAQDVDIQDIVATPQALVVGEGTSGHVDVKLAFQPAGPITVDVASLAPAIATATPATLTFAPADYDQPQTVTLTAPQDLDTVDGTTSLKLTAASLDRTVPVTVKDDDTLLVVTSAPAVTLGEAGQATFTVALTAQPQGNVVVSVTSNDATAATASPGALTFTPATWNTAQTVTVAGVADLDLVDETPVITLAAAGLPVQSVTATVKDDDAQVLVVSSASVNVTEGSTATFTIKLGFQPAANVIVSTASRDAAIATAAPATLTFTPANYATPQTVTVTGTQDGNATSDQTGLDITSPGLTPAGVMVAVTDDDMLGIQVANPTLNVGEGATANLGVRLTAQPAATTTVAIASSDGTAATASPTSLTFTAANWATYQNVAITGVQDADTADDTATLTLTSSGLATVTVAATIVDDDAQNILTTTNAVGLTETGSASFGVHLAAQPASDVIVTVASADPGAATVSTSLLTFTSGNWNVDQAVTVNGVSDPDLANEAVAITLASSGLATRTVNATVTDDDSQLVLVNPAAVTITEGQSGTVQVALAYAPTGSTTVTLAPANGAITVSPAALTFTAANYNQAQVATVIGVQDPDAIANLSSLSASAPGATTGSVNVTVVDDDTLGIAASPSSLMLGEAGSTTLNVHLTAQPTSDTTVFVASSDTGAATVSVAALTFTPANYATNQVVTVTGVADLDAANEAVTIALTNPSMATVNVGATVADDETQLIQTDVAAVSLVEGGTGTFKVRLAAQPLANTVVSVTSANTLSASVNTPALTFTPANYATYQTVTVTGVQDGNLITNVVSILMASPGLQTVAVTATVTDNDVQAIVRTPSALVVNEGGTGTFTVALAFQPSANTTVSVTSSATATATVSTSSLTFTPANYATPQTVTVSGVEDADLLTDATTVSLTSLGIPSSSVSVTVPDNDLITLSATSATLCPGDTLDVSVHLLAQPYQSVVVTASSNNTAVGTVSPASHTFTTANYATNQIYTITPKAGTTSRTTTIVFDAGSQAPKTFTLSVPSNTICNL